MPLSAVDVINPAFQRMKQQLFLPFRFGQWVRLAFVGFLAGEMGTGGGISEQFPPNQGGPVFEGMNFPAGGGPAFIALICILAR